jgi:transcriptional regulator with XRE-family HTH domain
MTGHQLEHYRKQKKRTQEHAARELGVSQAYLSLLESGKRPVTERLRKKAVKAFGLPPTKVPAKLTDASVRPVSDDQLAADLAALGYKGFSHLKPSRGKNPADVLLSALNSHKRDARLVEALPWLVLEFSDMPWSKLMRTAKAYDLQNRLGYVTNMARRVAESKGNERAAAKLKQRERELAHSLLAREETLCNETMTKAERKWLAVERPDEAKHWHLLTNLSPNHLNYYAG